MQQQSEGFKGLAGSLNFKMLNLKARLKIERRIMACELSSAQPASARMGVSLFWACVSYDLEIWHQAKKEAGKCILQCNSCWEERLLVDEVDIERGAVEVD